MTAKIIQDGPVRVRLHQGFGHGLRPGTDQDMNCLSCRREDCTGCHTQAVTGVAVVPAAHQCSKKDQS